MCHAIQMSQILTQRICHMLVNLKLVRGSVVGSARLHREKPRNSVFSQSSTKDVVHIELKVERRRKQCSSKAIDESRNLLNK